MDKQPMQLNIYCAGCNKKVMARLTDGKEIYPHRPDLALMPFWKCDACGNKVGCHHKTDNPTEPLGIIPTPELSCARGHIHQILDPLWKSGKYNRKQIYRKISDAVGWQYHTAKIRTVDEARIVYRIVQNLAQECSP